MISEIFEPQPRWTNGPRHCIHANLPAFESKKASGDFNNSLGHLPIIAEWMCNHYKCWHHWCGAPTDTNGQCAAGGDKVPESIQRLIKEAKSQTP